ncbi:MAG: S9 family peptidase [Acidobacteria bacterium]|nr:S9 family peptidase [Acidobacteriota bacterium]
MRAVALCVLAAVSLAPMASAETRPVTIDDVLGLRAVATPVLSPDGTAVLFTIRQWKDGDEGRKDARTNVWRAPADGSAPARQVTFGERGDTLPGWSPDGRYMSFVSSRGKQNGQDAKAQVWVMRTGGGEAWALTTAAESVAQYAWSPDGATVAFTAMDAVPADEKAAIERRDDEREYERPARPVHLWVVDLATKTATRITSGTDFTVQGALSWARDGQHVAFAAGASALLRDGRRDIYVADLQSKGAEKITTNFGPDTNPCYSPDGRSIAYIADVVTSPPIGDGTPRGTVAQSRLMLYEVATKATRDITGALTVDPGAPQWSPDGTRLVFTAGTRAYSEAWSLEVASGRATQLTKGRTLQLGTFSADGTKVAVIMDTPTAPADIHVADAAFTSLRKVSDANPQAREFALGATEVITWKSKDGLEVEGVLLKPVNFDPAKRYPLLVVAHGGPAGAYVNNYRVGGLEGGQVWAGQGWAVFYPNPRGSTNYGDKFLKANVADWGGGDFADIDSGVDALIERGIADQDKLAHIGWSYGGYMTAWTITQTQRYKAAMVGAGLTNMWSMYGTNDIPNTLIGYFGGIANKETLPLYLNRSAMTHIDNVTTPTLILHGASDDRVPVGQAQELFRGLKDRGKDTELVFYPREGHGISEYYHLQDRLSRIYGWVTSHVAGESAKPPTPRQ